MDEEYNNYLKKSHVPAFGSWDCNDDDLPFTQCFETARKAGLLRYSYDHDQDRDLYVTGDLYDNHLHSTPTMIVVPRKRGNARNRNRKVKEEKKERNNWVVCDYEYEYGYEDYDVKEPPTPVSLSPSPPSPPTPPPPTKAKAKAKAVDEDLYKISPDLLRAQQLKKKKVWGRFFSSCLRPMCS